MISIDSEGLRLVDPNSGATRPLPFATPEADVLAVVSRRGAPASSDVNAECGAGPTKIVQWPDGLSLLFQNDAFVGWSLDGRSAPKLTTMSGVGAGSTRAELEGAYAAPSAGAIDTDRMTVEDTVLKTVALFGVLLVTAVVGWIWTMACWCWIRSTRVARWTRTSCAGVPIRTIPVAAPRIARWRDCCVRPVCARC